MLTDVLEIVPVERVSMKCPRCKQQTCYVRNMITGINSCDCDCGYSYIDELDPQSGQTKEETEEFYAAVRESEEKPLHPPTPEQKGKLRKYALEVEQVLEDGGGCYRKCWGQEIEMPSYFAGILDTIDWFERGGEHEVTYGYLKTLCYDLATPPDEDG
jgi:hypothetical protein